ncbi:hypothetical protein [Fulvivirga sediminis]|uniref:DUF2007 domain-containing protein n=1 Tax=Fulvivirga sediminis TaxID=2803949 RepID=A0A937F5E0_9BACT|nr:hypothetical protein [Fulvivirga sediminis]MBL3655336.1 hypothetical protein [Fulvivirga sediminis]
MENWVVLGQYLDKDVLMMTEAILNGHKISFRVKSPESHLNSALGQATSQGFVVEVAADQYDLAKQLTESEGDVASDAEVPMEEYTTEELKEIILNPEDWHEQLLFNAKNELNRRGAVVQEEEIESSREEKIRQLEKGTEPSGIIYYFMWAFALLGGYIGIIAGYFYWRVKIKGFDGKRYYMYSRRYRNQGYYMFMLGVVSAILQTYIYIINR